VAEENAAEAALVDSLAVIGVAGLEGRHSHAGERPVTRPFEDVAARAPEGSHREGDAAAGTSGKFARWLTARPAGITGMQWAWTPAGAATAVSPWCWYEHQHSHL